MATPISALPSAPSIDVVGALPGTTVQILPNRRYIELPAQAIDTVALAELVPAGDGTFRVVARICPKWMGITKDNLRRFGVGISGSSLKRLIVAGFVTGQQTTPGVFQFDYLSFCEHVRRAQDPDFWDRTEPGHNFTNRQRLSSAI